MLLVLLPALFHPQPWPFLALALVMVGAGGWEWGRLNGLGGAGSWLLGLLVGAACGLAWAAGWPQASLRELWLAAGAFWILTTLLLLRGGVAAWAAVPRMLRLCGGVLVLLLAWLAIAQARVLGVEFLLSVFVLVWAADIGAYFAGRALGQKLFPRKLAPAISPGKSWEGALGGAVVVMVVGVVWSQLSPQVPGVSGNLYALLRDAGWPVFVLAVLFLTVMSVSGDLLESLVKRSAGAKDSSQLLPGHGGVLDRVDALLPVLPLAMMLAVLVA